jgi:hypothetical protein
VGRRVDSSLHHIHTDTSESSSGRWRSLRAIRPRDRTRSISLTSEEPDVDFTNSTELGTITLDAATAAAPVLLLTSLSGPFGHMIRILVRGTQAASTVTLTATLSIDLVVRDN